MNKEKELILKMLQENKISLEEAMKLLEQVDGDNYDNINNKNNSFNKLDFSGIISNFVKKTVDTAMNTATKASNMCINLDNRHNPNIPFKHSYQLKGDLPSNIESVNFNLKNADMHIYTEDIDSPSLKVYTHKHSDDDELNRRFKVHSKNGNLTLNEEFEDRNYKRSFYSDYNPCCKLELILPSGREYSVFELDTSNGSINVKGFKLDYLNARTSNGRIDLGHISSNTLHAISSNGNLSIYSINVKDINLVTSMGNIDLLKINTNTASAFTSMGNIKIYEVKDIGSKIKATSSMGDLHVDLRGIQANIELSAKTPDMVGKLNISDRFLFKQGSKNNRLVYTNTNFKQTILVHLNTHFGQINVK